MNCGRRRVTDRRGREAASRDRGAVDVSIQMLFGLMFVIFVMLLIFEAVTYWHARNVLDVQRRGSAVAAFDGTCGRRCCAHAGAATAGSGRDDVVVTCTEGRRHRDGVGHYAGVGNALGFMPASRDRPEGGVT